LIYNAHVPSEATLPSVDKIAAATPIQIQEVYGTPEVQKTIGPDLFGKLIPLSVHESASVYSEEKAKIVRAEVEKAENVEGEIRVGLESLGIKAGLGRFKEIAEGTVDDGVPSTVTAWQEEIRRKEQGESVEELLRRLEGLKTDVKTQLDSSGRDLDTETRECEAMRVSSTLIVTTYAFINHILVGQVRAPVDAGTLGWPSEVLETRLKVPPVLA
jgi:hypothetical protein